MAINLRTHVVPLGFDEIDRITVPLMQYKADRAFLVTHQKDNPIAQANLEDVKKELEKKLKSCEIEVKSTDIWDLFACLQTYREIFAAETANHVFVNVSTGSKITSIVGMLACMLCGGIPYYAKLDYSGIRSRPATHDNKGTKILGIENLPVYSIHQPSEESLKVLSIIRKEGGNVSKKILIKELQSERYQLIPIYSKDASKSAPHSKLRAILTPLVNEWKFVSIISKGRRSDVKLTSQGLRALRIFGDSDFEVPANTLNVKQKC